MNLIFIYTSEFDRFAEGVFTDEELRQVELLLMANPNAGVVMPGTGGVRKLRVALPGSWQAWLGKIHLLPPCITSTDLLSHALLEESAGGTVRGRETTGTRDCRCGKGGGSVMSSRHADTDFEASLLRGMEEMLAHRRGEIQLRTRTVEITPTAQEVSAPPPYDGARVRALRAKLSPSPQAFAAALNVSLRTLQAWEQDVRRPEGSTLRLLEIAEERPDALFAVVRRAG